MVNHPSNERPLAIGADGRPWPSFREAVAVWLRVALLSFGGPAGQISVMHRIVVEEKRWIGGSPAINYLSRLAHAPLARRIGSRGIVCPAGNACSNGVDLHLRSLWRGWVHCCDVFWSEGSGACNRVASGSENRC